MNSIYRGQDFSGIFFEQERAKRKKEEDKLAEEYNKLESMKNYIAPGVFTFMPTPQWLKPSVISFNK